MTSVCILLFEWLRCNTCGEYIYKGKKFNSRKETVENENYLGLHIFRFYIKCPRCIAEIAFKVRNILQSHSMSSNVKKIVRNCTCQFLEYYPYIPYKWLYTAATYKITKFLVLTKRLAGRASLI